MEKKTIIDQSLTHIYAKKGTMTTKFTKTIWKNMGKNKNGWEQITFAQFTGAAPTGASSGKAAPKPTGLGVETNYKKFMEQAAALINDGELATALQRYQSAYDLKPSTSLKGKMNKLGAQLEEQANAAARNELLANAESAFAEGDYDTALAGFEAAQEIEETKETTARIEATKAAMEESLVD